MPTMRTKLYVGNLPENFSEASLCDVFLPYSGLDQVAVFKNFAFVHFTDENEASKAVKDLDGTTIGDKKVSVEVSRSKGRGGRDGGGRDRDRCDRDRGSRRDRDRDGPRGPPRGQGGGAGLGPLIGGLGGLGGLGTPGGPLGGLGGALGGLGGGQLGGLGGGQLGGLAGGQLGGLGGGELGGIFSAVNTLAALGEKTQLMNSAQSQQQQEMGFLQQQQRQQQQQQQQQQPQQTYPDQPDANSRGRREAAPATTAPNAVVGTNNGYVIYERYYVDPSHALLKGLPLPQLPPLPDVRLDLRPEPQQQLNDNLRQDVFRDRQDVYRDRSPINGNKDFEQRNYDQRR